MFSGSPGKVSPGALMQRCKLRMRAFTSSQSGAVTVDFIPLVCAAIGLGFGVVAFTTAALESSSTKLASTMGDLEIQTNLPVESDMLRPRGDASTGTGDADPSTSTRPQIEVEPNTSPAPAGSATGGVRYTERRVGGVTVTMSGLPDASSSGSVSVTKKSTDSEFGDGWLFPNRANN